MRWASGGCLSHTAPPSFSQWLSCRPGLGSHCHESFIWTLLARSETQTGLRGKKKKKALYWLSRPRGTRQLQRRSWNWSPSLSSGLGSHLGRLRPSVGSRGAPSSYPTSAAAPAGSLFPSILSKYQMLGQVLFNSDGPCLGRRTSSEPTSVCRAGSRDSLWSLLDHGERGCRYVEATKKETESVRSHLASNRRNWNLSPLVTAGIE